MNDVRPPVMPKARKDRLIIKELPDETLVYDLNTDRAHCLNETASIVWKNCNGRNSITDLNNSLQKASALPVDEDVVWLALAQLEKFKLLSEVPDQAKLGSGITRRRVMRNLGLAAIALPSIIAIVAPTPALALSCVQPGLPPGTSCNNNGQCCSNVCAGPGGSKTCS